jgi:hypothetical protein
MRKQTLVIAVTTAFAGGLLLSGPAQAATNYLIVGGLNETTHQTTLKNTAGTPLYLHAPSSVAPLKVNSSTVVTNLNADKLDGISSGSFARNSMVTGVIRSGSAHLDEELNMYVATATCPEGTVRTGGGGYTTGIVAAASAPEPDGLGWTVVGQFDARAYAVCLSPNGKAIPGAVSAAVEDDVVTAFKHAVSASKLGK